MFCWKHYCEVEEGVQQARSWIGRAVLVRTGGGWEGTTVVCGGRLGSETRTITALDTNVLSSETLRIPLEYCASLDHDDMRKHNGSSRKKPS